MGVLDALKKTVDAAAGVVKTPVNVAKDVAESTGGEHTAKGVEDVFDDLEDAFDELFDL